MTGGRGLVKNTNSRTFLQKLCFSRSGMGSGICNFNKLPWWFLWTRALENPAPNWWGQAEVWPRWDLVRAGCECWGSVWHRGHLGGAPGGQGLCLSGSRLCFQPLAQCPTHSQHSANICRPWGSQSVHDHMFGPWKNLHELGQVAQFFWVSFWSLVRWYVLPS